MIETYINKVASITKRGDAREESYYPALAELLEQFSETKRRKKVHVTVLPKKTEAGNPDFRVWDGKHSQVGYVEAKPPKADLDDIETTDQLKRYIATFPNLILTNFYEFRLYRNGQRVDNVLLARPYIPTKLKAIPPAEHTMEFFALLEKFFQFSLPTKFTAESLANELATRTRFLRDQVIKEEIREARTEGAKKILGFYEAFQKHLIANLKADEFADLYAQTITYGLFAARTRANGVFNRKLAYDLIPKTIGILREIFSFISLNPPDQLEATVDDIAEVLAVADVKKILHQYFKEGKGSDPIFHFYETFLAEYNPKERERRGVYYTPEPVVSYIVRSLDIILKESFSRQDGFATHSVTVLDPAGGTLTFLAEAAKLAVDQFVSNYGEGSKAKFIEDHILQHFFAFELMMAPYAAGHLKMGYLLEELGHKLSGDERFQFYLTNTLEMEELAQTSLPGMASLSEESHLAGKIKKEKAPDGSEDKNVFDIQQGVAIVLLIKHKSRTVKCRIFHSDLWGLRDHRYEFLRSNDIHTVNHNELNPSSPFYFFVPKKETHRNAWESLPKVTDIFPANVTGVVTARDSFVIDFEKQNLRNRILQFRNSSLDDSFIRQAFKLKDTRGWKLPAARKSLANDAEWEQYFAKTHYRPFDFRWIYYTPKMIDWGRPELMRHMLQPNLSLCAMRQVALHEQYNHFLASEFMVDNRTFTSNKGIIQQFPLWLYPDADKNDLFSHHEAGKRIPNLAPKLLDALTSAYKRQATPEECFCFIYAVFYSNAYRKKYAEFLKTDFPRVPFTKDSKVFQKLAQKGAQLVDLHLLKSSKLAKPIAKCEGSGDLRVVKVSHNAKAARVYINFDKYFAGVPTEVWEYHIGGYQVAEKWLKDLKGRMLSSEEIATYSKIITAIVETISIQESLDDLFKEVESNLLEVSL